MSDQRGYLVVLFVIVLAFVAIVASMHLLVLTSVATASRAYDSFRQSSLELTRLRCAVAEAMLDQRQVSVVPSTNTLAEAVNQHLAELTSNAGSVSATQIPDTLPGIVSYPDASGTPDPLSTIPSDFASYLNPELSTLLGPRAAYYPEAVFRFTTVRTVFETTRTYGAEVRARLVSVPLTRFPIAAYELPADIGNSAATTASPATAMPAGLVPARDPAFIADLQAQPGVLPYHYRRRALLAAAYQYVFSQAYIDRVAEYAGIAHYCDLAARSGTAALAGLEINGANATWDLAQAGSGTYGTVTTTSDAAVVFTESTGYSLQLTDSAGSSSASPLCLLVLGPSNPAVGTLQVSIGAIARPLVLIAFNVRLSVNGGAAIAGALFLDPVSTFSAAAPVSVGHLSHWAGSTAVETSNVVASASMSASAEMLAPRVVYVAASAARL